MFSLFIASILRNSSNVLPLDVTIAKHLDTNKWNKVLLRKGKICLSAQHARALWGLMSSYLQRLICTVTAVIVLFLCQLFCMPYGCRQPLFQHCIPDINQIGQGAFPHAFWKALVPPTSFSHLPCRCINMKKATQAPRTLWSNVLSVCLAAQFFAPQESLSHAQTAGSNSDPCDTIQSLLCLAFWFLIDTLTARQR